MFSLKEIENDEIFQEFIDARGITKTTRYQHIMRMRIYCNYHEMTPEELFQEAEKEEDKGIKRKKRKIRRKFINFINHLKKENKSTNTIKTYLSTIMAFYEDCEIQLPKLPANIYKNKDLDLQTIASDEVPTKEHVKKAYNTSSIRTKAMILLHFSSGMDSATVRHLTYNDFINSLEEYLDLEESEKMNVQLVASKVLKIKDCIGTWKIARYKQAVPYVTFNSPESNHAIAEYLLDRLNNNKPILNKNDYLFVSVENKMVPGPTYITTFERLNERCNFGRRKNGYYYLTSHRLRVAFGTLAKEAGIESIDVKRLLGHKVDKTDDAYLKTRINKLKHEYMKVLPALTLNKLAVIEYQDEDVRKLIQDLDVVKLENKDIKELINDAMPYLKAMRTDPVIQERLKKITK